MSRQVLSLGWRRGLLWGIGFWNITYEKQLVPWNPWVWCFIVALHPAPARRRLVVEKRGWWRAVAEHNIYALDSSLPLSLHRNTLINQHLGQA
jgi:hypothetical protein